MSHKKCHNGYKERSRTVDDENKRPYRPPRAELEKEIKKEHKKEIKEAVKHEKQRHHDVKKELHNERKHWKKLDSHAREVKFKDLDDFGYYCKGENVDSACQCNDADWEPIPGTSQDPDWRCENCQDEENENLEREMQYSEIDIMPDTERDVQEDVVQAAPTPEISTESSSEMIWRSLLTDEEWMKYLEEKRRMEKEKAEHIRKLKEEHQLWKQRQREDHNEFKRKQKEAHKEWKRRQKQEHDEWRKKLKLNREEAKRKNKVKSEREIRKKTGEESPDSEDSEDSDDGEDDDEQKPRHKILPWRKEHEGGVMHSIRSMFHHAARNLYRASGAKRTWRYVRKKIIRRVLRRTYRNVSRHITSFLELFDTKAGNALILLGLLVLGVLLGGYLFSHLHRNE